MALANYTDLKTTIANYLARDDLTSQIPDFIKLAEIRLSRDIRINEMLSNTALTLVSNEATLPSNYLEMRSIYFNSNPYTTLEYQTPDLFSRNMWNTDSGTPVYFSIIGDKIKFAPTNDSADTLQLFYYAKPAELSNSNLTNVWTANCMDALLYASLGESEAYLMNDPRIQTWAALYDRSLAAIAKNDSYKKNPNIELAVTAR